MALDREVRVVDMQGVIARAWMAAKRGDTEEIIAFIRSLSYRALVDEYHHSVVYLDSRGLLTEKEQGEVEEYAKDWIENEGLHAL